MNENICAELLQPILKAGIVCSKCYWQSTPKGSSLTVLPLSPSHSNNVSSITVSSDAATSPICPTQSGANVSFVVILLTQLCISSLGPNVPPQDTLTALEGLGNEDRTYYICRRLSYIHIQKHCLTIYIYKYRYIALQYIHIQYFY